MGKFDGKVVIVTGSSSGIGQAIAVAFAKEGALVMLHGRDEKGIQETKNLMAKAKIPSNHYDHVLGSLESEKTPKEIVKKTIEKFKQIDVLVNAAGIAAKPNCAMDSMENYKFVMDVNLKAPVQLTLLCVPHLEKTKGNVVNISAIASVIPSTFMPFYGMAKAALDHFTRNYAVILGKKGIRINCLNPGIIRTNFQSKMLPGEEGKKLVDSIAKTIPLGRTGNAEEIAETALFIASATYMTGAINLVDGGITLSHGH